MSTVHLICDGGAMSRGSVVFVHGLAGDSFTTWGGSGADSSFWPRWIGEEMGDVAVYSLAYDAAVSNWSGHAMPLPDRATNMIATLAGAGMDDGRSIVFVCHSLGGLVVKQALRVSSDGAASANGWLFRQARGVAFLATPNSGSDAASLANLFGILARPSSATRELKDNDAHLRDLSQWYRGNAEDSGIRTIVFREGRQTKGILVVDEASADPGVHDVRPIPIDADHIGICKPTSRTDTVHAQVRRFIAENLERVPSLAQRGGPAAPAYHVFISHSRAQRDWVEALGRNLLSAGKSVFLDVWRLVPGRDWVQGLRDGLASCRAAILVVSPEALDSGWVREEYEVLRRRRSQDPGFAIIPVVLTDVPADSPFAGDIQWVDFRTVEEQKVAFARLLAGLEGREPGLSPTYHGPWEPLPGSQARSIGETQQEAIKNVMNRLFNTQAVAIQAQEGSGFGPIAREIARLARERFGEAAVFQLAPSYVTAEEGTGPFFGNLAEQIGPPNAAASHRDFHCGLEDRLRGGQHLMLVMTSIEHSPPVALEAFCGVLRALGDMYQNFRMVFCGGERLSEMRSAKGVLSYLSHAQLVPWPDPGEAEIRAECEAIGAHALPDGIISEIGRLAGGHVGLIRELAAVAAERGADAKTLAATLEASPAIWTTVWALIEQHNARLPILRLVESEDVAPAPAYVGDAVVRRLYWANLLARRLHDGRYRLMWRSPAIQEAVRRVIADNGQ